MSTAPQPWFIQLLGGLSAWRGGVHLHNFGGRSAAALLARLALHPQRSHSREELIELLWPGVALEAGRNRLRQALFTLRQAFPEDGAELLLADRLALRVAPGALRSDVAHFEAAMNEGRAAEACALYTGEFMPGFYEDWVDEERLRLAALQERAQAQLNRSSPVRAAQRRLGLPIYLTCFFGREAERERLAAELRAHRLVSLLGPGGAGKTRLAVALAESLSADEFDTIAFVPLTSAQTLAQLQDALLAALHLPPAATEPMDTLRAALSGRRTLLVLDNFEQLAAAGAPLLARLGSELPELHLLVTTRRVLGLDGERELVIESLALPARGMPAEQARQSPALALFLDRARAVRPDFDEAATGPDALAELIELVHLLEGMPLAIELAAARSRSAAPGALAELLRQGGHRLALLQRAGPRAGGDPRHASMQDVIAWSWQLLDPAEARLLARLAVFDGGFTAEAAEAVCGEPGAAPVSLALDALLADSLLRAERRTREGPLRFALSEPVREFAARHLPEDAARDCRARHRRWMAYWARGLPATPALNEVRAELPNLLAAFASALADDAAADAIRLALPLRRVFEDVHLPAEGMALLARAVEASDGDPALQSQGHSLLGPVLFRAGQPQRALHHAEAGLATAPPGSAWRARALHALAQVRWRSTRKAEGVTELIEEAWTLADGLDLQASLLSLQAFMANSRRDLATGQALHSQALALWERLGNEHAINSGRYNLAVSAQLAGRHEEALARLAPLLASARASGDRRRLGQSLNVRGEALTGLRRWAEAAASYRESIAVAWEGMSVHDLAYGLWNLPRPLAHLGEAERAVQLAGFVARFWATSFGPLGRGDQHDLRRLRRLARCRLDAAQVEALWSQGEHRLTLAEAVALSGAAVGGAGG